MFKILIFIILGFYAIHANGQNNCFIEQYNTTITIENKNEIIVEKMILAYIANQQSNWIADIEVYFQQGDKVNILEAQILDKNGIVVREIKNKDILTVNNVVNGSFFEDQLKKAFNLNWHQYPYYIKYKYRITETKFIGICDWMPLHYKNVSVASASLKVILPIDYHVKINTTGNLSETKDTIEDKIIAEWKIDTINSFRRQIYSPPIIELIPRVTIVPDDFFYGIDGNTNSWSNFGLWQSSLIEKLSELTPTEKTTVDNLIKGVTDQRQIISILYHYLQDNTRYINISMDIGGLKPYPATYVCEKKYGDCKALSNYMKALLNYVGIQSYYTLVYAGNNPNTINKSLPSQQFNHAILCVPLPNDTIWLENTASHLPVNYLGSFTQNRDVLFVNNDQSKLIQTPKLLGDDVFVNTNYHYNLDDNGNGNVIIASTLRGERFDHFSYLYHAGNKEEQRDAINEFIQLKNYELLDWELNSGDRDSSSISLIINASVSNQARVIANNCIFNSPLMGIPAFDKVKTRVYPVRIICPINKKDSTSYQIANIDQYQVKLPANIEITNEYGHYSEQWSFQNGIASQVKIFRLNNGEYSLNEYPPFYAFINQIVDVEKNSLLILKKK